MNRFLEYLLFNLNEDKQIVEELINVDNHIQGTNFKLEDLIIFIKENLQKNKLLELDIRNKIIVLTEGEPILILKLLNDFPTQINKIFINRSFIAINNWILRICLNYYQNLNESLNIDLDIKYHYDDYFDYTSDILVIGNKEFIEGIQNDFSKVLLQFII